MYKEQNFEILKHVTFLILKLDRLDQRLKNEEISQRVKEERDFLHAIKIGKVDWNGHIWIRNCRLKHVVGGKIVERIEMMRKRGRRRKKLLDEVKET